MSASSSPSISTPRPARGTRPANRRELILTAATDLFAARGYEHVNMAAVAAEVAVGPSALYRHFPGKESLLQAVIERAGSSLRTAAEHQPDDLTATVRAVAAVALDHRSLGVLLQREARHLPREARTQVVTAVVGVRDQLGARITSALPGTSSEESRILAAAVLGILFSASFHHVELPRGRLEDLLAETALRALAPEGPRWFEVDAVPEAERPLGRSVRRESLLRVALDLFAEGTYASVSMEDVATAAGMATSSVYLHFPSKVHLLSTALARGNGYLQLDLDRALHATRDETQALQQLVASYCRFAFAHPAIVDLLITETRTLPAEEGVALTQSQRDYVAEWVHLYRAVSPGLGEGEATVVVQGALMLMNDLARMPQLRFRTEAESYVAGLACRALLGP